MVSQVHGFDLLAFRLHGRRLALDLVATLGGRTGASPVERLAEPQDLSRWLEAVGLVGAGARASVLELAEARELRELIRELAEASIAKRRARRSAVERLNALARRQTPAPQLDANCELAIERAGDSVRRALAAIARDAIQLLGGPERDRLKECSSPSCGLLFVDESRGRRRRWCSMQACGNRAKTRSYRQRRKGART
jgi:predicted RNA-binding Zn ribbon-like protein